MDSIDFCKENTQEHFVCAVTLGIFSEQTKEITWMKLARVRCNILGNLDNGVIH